MVPLGQISVPLLKGTDSIERNGTEKEIRVVKDGDLVSRGLDPLSVVKGLYLERDVWRTLGQMGS